MNRKRLILVILLGILALCLIYAYLASPRLEKAPPKVAGKRTSSTSARPGKKVTEVGAQRVPLELLQKEAQPFPGAARDIFQFKQHQPIAPIEIPEETAEVEPVFLVPPEPTPVAPSMPFEIVQQSLGRFTFIGFMDKGGEKTVFLSTGGELFVVKRGERFGSDLEFLVDDIKENTLLVNSNGTSQVIEIPLIENEQLVPSVSAPAPSPAVEVERPSSFRGFAPRPLGSPERPRVHELPRKGINPFAAAENDDETPMEETREEEPRESGEVLQGEPNGTNQ